MKLLHGLITLLAGLMILFLGGSWLAYKKNFGPDFGIWGKPTWVGTWRGPIQIPTEEPGSIRIGEYIPYSLELFVRHEQEYLVLPVGHGDFNGGSMGYGYTDRDSGATWSEAGNCNDYTTNLIIVTRENPISQTLFNSRLFIPHYFSIEDGDARSIAAIVVRNDTNRDGVLDCQDDSRLEVFRFSKNSYQISEHIVSEHTFLSSERSRGYIDLKENTFVTYEPIADGREGVVDIVRISLDDLSFSRTPFPATITEAQRAFDRGIDKESSE